MNDAKHDSKVDVTVLVDGVPKPHTFPANKKVRQVIHDLLPHGEKPEDYELIDRDVDPKTPLDPAKSLFEAGVLDGHTLSLTKKDGGGG